MDAPVRFNPFPGLRSFEPEEDYLFFGRDRQIEELLDKLGQTRFLAVVGVSGSGKSSLVKAGMIPALYGGYSVRTGSNWRIAVTRPEDHPFRNLAETLAEEELLGGDDATGAALLETVLRSSAVGLVDCVRQARLPAKENILVVIDQFEELFRFRGEDKDEALAFVRLLLEAARQETLPIYIAITMRSDFIGDCMRFPDLPEAINCGQYLTPRLSREELRAAIAAPAAVAEGKISHRLLTRLLNDLGDDQDQLPVLQHALMRMWDCRQSDAPIDLIHYENIGGLKTALSRHAEEIYGELDGREQGIAEKLFKLLTDRDAEGKGVRRPARIEEVCAITGASEAEVIAVIEHFRARGRSFLMPPVGVELSGASKIDISHESLMRVWTRLSGWVEDETRDADRFRRLSDAAQQQRAGEAGLLQDPALQIVLDWWQQSQPTTAWATRYSGDFDLAERFLRESKKAREQREREAKAAHERELEQARALAKAQEARAEEQKTRAEEQARSAKRSRYLAAAAMIAMIVAIATALIAWKLQGRAVEAQQNAEASGRIAFARQLAADSKDVLSSNPQRAMLLAMSGILATEEDKERKGDRFGVADAEEALREAFRTPLADSIALVGHEGWVGAVAFSPDGRTLASAGEDGTVRLWDTGTGPGEPLILRGHEGGVSAVAFSPDGRTLASAGFDGTVRLWDTGAGAGKPLILRGHEGRVSAVAFSPDGRTLASAGKNGTVRLWDRSAGAAAPLILRGHEGGVSAVAFSPDGRTLASPGEDGTVRLWRLHHEELIERACRSLVHNLTISEWRRHIGNRRIQLACMNRPIHESFFNEAYRLADSGDFEAAMAYFRSIQDIDPRFDFDSVIDEARRRAAKSLTKQSGRLAEQGDAQGAIKHYRQAKQLDPDTEFKPPDFAIVVTAKSFRLARQGHIERALEVFTRSWLFNPDLRNSAKYWNFLCWHSSLWNQAKRVIDACENAVRLAPNAGPIRDSRGVARALLGDYQGAVDDFRYFLEWARENGKNQDLLRQRENWIKELEAGHNPFDEETLAELRQTE